MRPARPITVSLTLDPASPFEQFVAVALDREGTRLAEHRSDSSSINSAPVDFRKIVGMALRHDAHALVVAHTHPSGDPQPSKTDVATTRALARLCAGLQIHLADHLILASGGRFSFREAGLM